MSKEKTVDQIRDEFLTHVEHLVEYWDKNTKDKREAMEGLAFSIMSTLDGSSMALPAFLVAPFPHESDKEYHIENESDYYPYNDESKINGDIAGCLHELIFKDRKD
jgi:hypothetical protein